MHFESCILYNVLIKIFCCRNIHTYLCNFVIVFFILICTVFFTIVVRNLALFGLLVFMVDFHSKSIPVTFSYCLQTV